MHHPSSETLVNKNGFEAAVSVDHAAQTVSFRLFLVNSEWLAVFLDDQFLNFDTQNHKDK